MFFYLKMLLFGHNVVISKYTEEASDEIARSRLVEFK